MNKLKRTAIVLSLVLAAMTGFTACGGSSDASSASDSAAATTTTAAAAEESKAEALVWFEKADKFFKGPQWKYCWVREANEMYLQQCHEKLKK